MNAAFFDIFGAMAFLFIILFSFYILYKNKKPSKLWTIILLVIGIIGLIVDLINVYYYLK